jgi:hypothetical protein
MPRRDAALVVGVLIALVCIDVPELASDPWSLRPPVHGATGLLGPLVRAAGPDWDLGVPRSAALLGAVVAAIAAIVVLLAGERARRIAVYVACIATCLALIVPTAVLAAGFRASSPPWTYTNDSTYQIELAGGLLRHGTNPYGHDYTGSGMEKFYTGPDFANTPPPVALKHFPYFPAMAVAGAVWGVLPGPLDDFRLLLVLCTLAIPLVALAFPGPLPLRLAVGVALACSPIAIRAAWYGLADAPAVLGLLGAFALARRGRLTWALALVGVAVLFKQFCLLAAPFLLLEAWRSGRWPALWRPLAALAAVVVIPAVPFLIWDAHGFINDTVTFGADTYRVIGYGLAGLAVRAHLVSRTGNYPFPVIAALTWLPATVLLLVAQWRRPVGWILPFGFAVSMFALLYVARVFQVTYLIYPLAGLAAAVLSLDRDPEPHPA